MNRHHHHNNNNSSHRRYGGRGHVEEHGRGDRHECHVRHCNINDYRNRHDSCCLNTSSSSSSDCTSSDSDIEYQKSHKKLSTSASSSLKGHSIEETPEVYRSNNGLQCSLCWHPIQPLDDTELLGCRHIYHRRCLKQLLDLSFSTKSPSMVVYCTKCKCAVDQNLVNEFKEKLFRSENNTESIDSPYLKVVMDLKNLKN